jgi:hypothetical protein
MKFLILFLSLYLINCKLFDDNIPVYTSKEPQLGTSEKRIISIALDKTFHPFMHEAADEIISEFNYALNNQMELKIISHNFDMEPSDINYILSRDGFLILNIPESSLFLDDKPNEKTLERCNKIGGNKMFLPESRISKSTSKAILRHGLSHLLGAKHLDNTLMDPHFSLAKYSCIDRSTAQQMAEFNHLNIHRMNYCE